MTVVSAEQLKEWIDDTGELTAESYSGRAMYGARCVSVTIEQHENPYGAIAAICLSAVASASDQDEAEDRMEALSVMMTRTRSDNMGLGTVLYWPDKTWPKSADEHADEDDEGAEPK